MSGQERCFGSRLLPQILDELSRSAPGRLYATIPRLATNLSQGFQDITMKDATIYVDALAWWLHEAVGPSDTFETLSYIGIPDIRAAFVFLAAIKCGYKVRPVPDLRVPELKPKRYFYLPQGIPLQRTEDFFLKLAASSYFMRRKQFLL